MRHGDQCHRWDVGLEEALRIQEAGRHRVVAEDRLGSVRLVAGADARFDREAGETWAVVAVLGLPELEVRETAVACAPTRFPYVPGLFSFREAPAVLEALGKLAKPPDLLICDGHGIAHPRRFGLASHVGVLADVPAVGVAKSRLAGTHGPVGTGRGEWASLVDGDEQVGAALRTRTGAKPVYVSVGHRVSLETAIRVVLGCTRKFRLPEPLRLAHRLAASAQA